MHHVLQAHLLRRILLSCQMLPDKASEPLPGDGDHVLRMSETVTVII